MSALSPASVPGSGELLSGVVAEWSEERGLGVVEDDEGRRFRFHVTSRAETVELRRGTAVVFVAVLGRLGDVEAAGLRRAQSAGASPEAST